MKRKGEELECLDIKKRKTTLRSLVSCFLTNVSSLNIPSTYHYFFIRHDTLSYILNQSLSYKCGCYNAYKHTSYSVFVEKVLDGKEIISEIDYLRIKFSINERRYTDELIGDVIFGELENVYNKNWKNMIVKLLKDKLCKECKLGHIQEVYKRMWMLKYGETKKLEKTKNKEIMLDWMGCVLVGKATIEESKNNRRIELSNIDLARKNEYRIFDFFNEKMSLPKEMILEILSFFHYSQRLNNDKNRGFSSSPIKKLINSVGLVNSSFYLATLEAIGRFDKYFFIKNSSIHRIPLLVLHNLFYLYFLLDGVVVKDMKYVLSNIPNIREMVLFDSRKYDYFMNCFKKSPKTNLRYLRSLSLSYETVSQLLELPSKDSLPSLENLSLGGIPNEFLLKGKCIKGVKNLTLIDSGCFMIPKKMKSIESLTLRNTFGIKYKSEKYLKGIKNIMAFHDYLYLNSRQVSDFIPLDKTILSDLPVLDRMCELDYHLHWKNDNLSIPELLLSIPKQFKNLQRVFLIFDVSLQMHNDNTVGDYFDVDVILDVDHSLYLIFIESLKKLTGFGMKYLILDNRFLYPLGLVDLYYKAIPKVVISSLKQFQNMFQVKRMKNFLIHVELLLGYKVSRSKMLEFSISSKESFDKICEEILTDEVQLSDHQLLSFLLYDKISNSNGSTIFTKGKHLIHSYKFLQI